MIEITRRWSLTSSGAAAAEAGAGLQQASNLTFVAAVEGITDTASIGIEHALNSTGNFERQGSTLYSISSGVSVTIQLNGPLLCVRPFVISRTASTTVVVIKLVGNSGAW